jgi:hypothetical protein
MSMKNSNDNIGNRTCELPPCSAVPRPTAPPAVCIDAREIYFKFFYSPEKPAPFTNVCMSQYFIIICNISFKNLNIASTLHIIKYTEPIFVFLKFNVADIQGGTQAEGV